MRKIRKRVVVWLAILALAAMLVISLYKWLFVAMRDRHFTLALNEYVAVEKRLPQSDDELTLWMRSKYGVEVSFRPGYRILETNLASAASGSGRFLVSKGLLESRILRDAEENIRLGSQNKFLEKGSGGRLKVKISNKPDQETPQDERTQGQFVQPTAFPFQPE